MNQKDKLAFGRKNYIIMLAGLAVMGIGFICMAMDSEQYGFGVLGITIGPIILMAGFVIEIFAIMAKPK